MNTRQNNANDENKNIIANHNPRLKAPTSLKRPSAIVNEGSKIRKVNENPVKRFEPNLVSTTFTISNKTDKPLPVAKTSATRSNATYNRTINTTVNFNSTGVKKRPTWDLKGRILDLEVLMKANAEEATSKIETLEEECTKLKEEAASNENKLSQLTDLSDRLKTENKDLFDSLTTLREENVKLSAHCEEGRVTQAQLEAQNSSLLTQNKSLADDLEITTNKLSHLEQEYSTASKELSYLRDAFNKSSQDLSDAREKLANNYNELLNIKQEYSTLNLRYGELQSKFTSITAELDKTKIELASLIEKFDKLTASYKEKCYDTDKMTIELNSVRTERLNLLSSLDENQKRILETVRELENQIQVNSTNDQQISILKHKLGESDHYKENLTSDLTRSQNELFYLRSEVVQLRNRLALAEKERRILHHRVMELRGTIRVCCRVRPALSSELNNSVYIIEYKNSESLVVSSSNQREKCTGEKVDANKYDFTFDQIFSSTSTQADVFEEIEPLVQSALDGYSVCIFAYGQTGSGKTYTMEGDSSLASNVGLIQRSVNKIFESMVPLKANGWNYRIQVSFLEIYNETIRDLLVNDFSKNLSTKLEIKLISQVKNDKSGKRSCEVLIPNLTIVDVEDSSTVIDLIKTANKNRSVAATKCNEFSSRSHSVFQLKLSGVNEILNENCESLINLVDLAGSERLSQSGAEGDRMKETQHINKSLSCLKTVITSLYNKESHVPYRDSKLTYLLQPSLGGNCKTLMFVNISPLEDSLQESINSLRFAATVNKCVIGNASQKKSSTT